MARSTAKWFVSGGAAVAAQESIGFEGGSLRSQWHRPGRARSGDLFLERQSALARPVLSVGRFAPFNIGAGSGLAAGRPEPAPDRRLSSGGPGLRWRGRSRALT